jgi:hypothetical protein
LTKDNIATLHITDITTEEVKRQLGDMAAEVAATVNKGNRLMRNWHSVRSTGGGKHQHWMTLRPTHWLCLPSKPSACAASAPTAKNTRVVPRWLPPTS